MNKSCLTLIVFITNIVLNGLIFPIMFPSIFEASERVSKAEVFYDGYPDWSPDGSAIAFTSERHRPFDIWLMEPDGSNVNNLTGILPYGGDIPVWSPDGQFVAFGAFDEKEGKGIWIINKDGTDPFNFTGLKDSLIGRLNLDYKWSPDQKYISFVSFENEDMQNSRLLLFCVSDHTFVDITPNQEVTFYRHAWGPDSKYLALTSSGGSLWILNIEEDEFQVLEQSLVLTVDWSQKNDLLVGTCNKNENLMICLINLRDLEITYFQEGFLPVWSPDGLHIAYLKLNREDGTRDIWVMKADGSGSMKLTDAKNSEDAEFSWSPDGNQIVFVSDRSGDSDIWVMNVDGTNPVNLTGDF